MRACPCSGLFTILITRAVPQPRRINHLLWRTAALCRNRCTSPRLSCASQPCPPGSCRTELLRMGGAARPAQRGACIADPASMPPRHLRPESGTGAPCIRDMTNLMGRQFFAEAGSVGSTMLSSKHLPAALASLKRHFLFLLGSYKRRLRKAETPPPLQRREIK